MALPALPLVVSSIASALAAVSSWIMQAIRTLQAISWRRIIAWLILSAFVTYFAGVVWLALRTSLTMMTTVFDTQSVVGNASPMGFLSRVHSLAGFWVNIQETLPSFWRWFLYYIGFDWMAFLFAHSVHFWLVGFLLDRFARPIATFLHTMLHSL